MSVIVEFTIPSEAFPFGRAVSGDPRVKVWLERVVPLGNARIPFFWATDHEFEEFERVLRSSEIVTHVEAVARVENSVLYYVEWDESGETFLEGLVEAGGTILEAHGDSAWSFTVRFNSHAALTEFHRFYQDEGFPVHIDRVSAPSGDPGQSYGFGLTPTQREALFLALEEGYFAVPRETKLEEIADELGITRQAVSELVRRGTEKVLRKALVGFTATDFEGTDE